MASLLFQRIMNSSATRVRLLPGGGEDRLTTKMGIQSSVIYMPIDADVEEGDLIERTLRNGKTETLKITDVHQVETVGPGGAGDHIKAKYQKASNRPETSQRKVAIPGLHAHVSGAAGALYEDGHYSRAVGAAFQAVEARVQSLSGSSEIGKKLMGFAIGGALDVTTSTGPNQESEREGFKHLFMGAMAGLRNPRAHGEEVPVSAEETLESLAFASLLMRRLDVAQERMSS